MTLSWRARRAIETERVDTVADGIAARVPVQGTLSYYASAKRCYVTFGSQQP
jgi:hypothetical protein